MATTYFVDSNAGGLNNGTSWANAWTSLQSADGIATTAGDIVLVADNHNETIGSGYTVDFSGGTATNPVLIYSASTSDDSYSIASSAQFSGLNSDFRSNGFANYYGIYFDIDDDWVEETSNEARNYYDCTFLIDDDWTFLGSRVTANYYNCTIDLTSTGLVSTGDNLRVRFYNCVFNGSKTSISSTFTGEGSFLLFDSCDMSNITTGLTPVDSHGSIILFKNCKMGNVTSWVSWTNGTNSYALAEGCTDGTITVPELGLTHYSDIYGDINSELTQHRNSGANDGAQANEHSWKMVSTASVSENGEFLRSPPISRWINSGSQTLRFFLAGAAALQDDEFWVELSSPSEAGLATARNNWEDSKVAIKGTPANLTTDSVSTWDGAGVGTKQQIDFAINPTIEGPVTARFVLAKASTTVYVDPRIEVV